MEPCVDGSVYLQMEEQRGDERYDLTDFRGEEGLAQAYNQRLEEYKKEKIEQKEEFERFGYISKYTMQEE